MPVKDTVKIEIIAETKKAIAGVAKFSAAVAGVSFAVKKALDIINDLQQAYYESERANAKLAAAFKATGGAVGITVEQLRKMAREMSRLTAIDDEAITETQALMLTFTKIGQDVFPKAIKAAADMSVMFGQDLKQSAIQLGTALNDPIMGVGRLRRIGISFTKEQKNMIAGFMEVNDLASAQKVILDELSAEFGGVAEAMGETAEAAEKQLTIAIGNLKEELGGMIAENTKESKVWLADMVNNFADAIAYQRELVGLLDKDLKELNLHQRQMVEDFERINSFRYWAEKGTARIIGGPEIYRRWENQQKTQLGSEEWREERRAIWAQKDAKALQEVAEEEARIAAIVVEIGDLTQNNYEWEVKTTLELREQERTFATMLMNKSAWGVMWDGTLESIVGATEEIKDLAGWMKEVREQSLFENLAEARAAAEYKGPEGQMDVSRFFRGGKFYKQTLQDWSELIAEERMLEAASYGAAESIGYVKTATEEATQALINMNSVMAQMGGMLGGLIKGTEDLARSLLKMAGSIMMMIGASLGPTPAGLALSLGGGLLGSFQGGGHVPETGPYLLHKDEHVTPAGGGPPIVVNINAGSVIAEDGLENRILSTIARFSRGR